MELYYNIPENLLPPEFFTEIKRFHKKKKEVEFRLKIDHSKFLIADDTEARKLIIKSILRSVDIGEEEFKAADFDFKEFRQDLIESFESQGWLDVTKGKAIL